MSCRGQSRSGAQPAVARKCRGHETDPKLSNWVRFRLACAAAQSQRVPPARHRGPHLKGQSMHFTSHWNVDQTRILTRRELGAVLPAPAKSQDAQRNRIIVRLACFCGLRVSEIGKLAVGDVLLEGARPHLRPQKGNTKGKKGRRVPLWRDCGTLADLRAWKAARASQGAKDGGSVRLLGAEQSGGPRPPARRDPATVPFRLQGAGERARGNAYDSPWAPYLHFTCARWRAVVGGGTRCGGPRQRRHHERLPARRGRRRRGCGRPLRLLGERGYAMKPDQAAIVAQIHAANAILRMLDTAPRGIDLHELQGKAREDRVGIGSTTQLPRWHE